MEGDACGPGCGWCGMCDSGIDRSRMCEATSCEDDALPDSEFCAYHSADLTRREARYRKGVEIQDTLPTDRKRKD